MGYLPLLASWVLAMGPEFSFWGWYRAHSRYVSSPKPLKGHD